MGNMLTWDGQIVQRHARERRISVGLRAKPPVCERVSYRRKNRALQVRLERVL